MSTLRQWAKTNLYGEPIEAVIFGSFGWDYESEDGGHPEKGRVYTELEAASWLDAEFDNGYGSPETYAVAIYSASWVMAVRQYDGSTAPFSLPRNPTAGFVPCMPGG